MRERARDKGRLEDIIQYSDNISKFIEGLTFDELFSDARTYYAIMKNVEIVGEAAYMLTKDFKRNHPQTPWKLIQGMRHFLVHEYAQVVPKILWGTATDSIPELRSQVEQYLTETDWEAWVNGENYFDKIDEQTLQLVLKMKQKGATNEFISDVTGFTVAEIIQMTD